MAIDNLNYYSSWLPAWQQTDKYSSQPWCLKSKNLDIFSSSKSVKATAWSAPSTTDSDIIKQDWKLILKTDWKVYERNNWVDTLVVDPSVNFPEFDVCYTGLTWTYAAATWWTPQDMVVKYVWDDWESFIVFTDRSSFLYSKNKFVVEKTLIWERGTQLDDDSPFDGYEFRNYNSNNNGEINIKFNSSWFTIVPVRIWAEESEFDSCNISLTSAQIFKGEKYWYDPQMDSMVDRWWKEYPSSEIPAWELVSPEWLTFYVPVTPWTSSNLRLQFAFVVKEGQAWYDWSDWIVHVHVNWWPANYQMTNADGTKSDWDNNYYYSCLPLRDRELVDIGSYGYSSSYWMKWIWFQTLYKWTWNWVVLSLDKHIFYDFVQDMWWENDTAMDIVGMTVWNEQVYMIGNLDGNWYIIPCDLSGWRWTPFIAYWCTFHAATNIDYLLYLVWEDRWVSTLWVFNQQELVPIVGWKIESQYTDLVGVDETYKFNGDLINWRKNLILSTTDNRIFQYGQTYGGKWGVFIHELPAGATLNEITTKGNDLEIQYSVTSNNVATKYSIKYQDDTPIKNYNTEWCAVYPIILWNHLLEKEESDLYTSYILPSSSCSLEFWGMANHYHFWTFTSSDNVTIDPTGSYKMAWATWDYELKFIERNEDQYTFRLEWDLPVQTTSIMKITDGEGTDVINYSEFNHFRKIWEITTDGYQEWEFRFHNLNNKLELPKSYSLQIMVKGKGTAQYTPELFALDLVANQRDRW